MVFKSLNGLGPSYLSDVLLPYEPSRALRSSGSCLDCCQSKKPQHTVKLGFSIMSVEQIAAPTAYIFKHKLETYLFSLASGLTVLLS